MINSGLRAYLLKERGQPGAQAFRSSWTCNGCAYAALQEFIRDLKAAGVLDQPQAQPDPGQPGSRALAFAGMADILESERGSRATVLRWGSRPELRLLAWGCASGAVHLRQIGTEPGLKWEHACHQRPVTDLAFHPEDQLLLSVAADGGACVAQTADGQLTRTLMGKAALSCCRFLAGNASLLLLGTAAGEVLVYNYAVGQLKDRALLRDKAGHEDTGAVQAMAVAGSVLLVASSSGALCSFRCATHEGLLQPIRALASCQLSPARRPAAVASLATAAFSGHCAGPALLISFATCQLAMYRIQVATGTVELLSQATMPIAARPIRAAFCPSLGDVTQPELIVQGAEDTGVCIWDLHASSAQLVLTLPGHAAPVVDCAWSADERLLASCDCDGIVIVWRRG